MLSLLEVLISLRKTSILLLKAFLGPLAVTFPVALFVLDMQFLWVYADEFMGKGIEPWVILKLIFFVCTARFIAGSRNMVLKILITVLTLMSRRN